MLGIFHAVNHGRDIRQPHRRAIPIRHDHRPITVAGDELIVGSDRVRLMQAIECAFGLVDIGLAQGGAQIFQAHAIGGQGRGIGLNSNSRALPAADADKPDSRELRNLLRERGVGEVFDFRERQRRRTERERHDGRVSGIHLAVDWRIRKSLREEIGSAIDGCLNPLFSDIDAQIQAELQGDNRAAKRTRRRHLVQAGNLAELALQRRRHRRSHHVRAGTRIKRLYLNRGVIDLR